MDADKNNFEPAFNFIGNETSFLLGESATSICIDNVTYTGVGQAHMDLMPRPGIRLYAHFNDVPGQIAPMVMFGQKLISSFRFNDVDIEGFSLGIGGSDEKQEISVNWCPKSLPVCCVIPKIDAIQRVVFHIFNFADVIGSGRTTEGIELIEHIDLLSDDWKVEIKSLPQTKENLKTLKENGGYRLTHIGTFRRVDAQTFEIKDAEAMLASLQNFLSFTKGLWCGPLCPVGFDKLGARIWESWSSPREPWLTSFSWCDLQTDLNLRDLFPCYMNRCANEDWQKTIQEVIYWYLAANNSARGIDAGIILTQTAIERLSYQFVVNDKRLLTAKGFKDLWASDKFRLLFSSLGLLLDIPAETAELKNLLPKASSNGLMHRML